MIKAMINTAKVKFTKKDVRVITNTLLVALDLKYETGECNPLDKGHEIVNILRKINAAVAGIKYKSISQKEFPEIAEVIECERLDRN